MAELIEDSISENGAGYADQKIDNNSGVGQVSSAIKGYNPYDGTYTYKQGTKWLQSHPDFKPIDTDDDELNAINTSYNQSLSNYLVDPALKSVIYQYDPEYGGHGEDDYRDEMDQFMMEEYGKSDYDTQINTLSSEQAKFEREDNQYLLGRLIADGVPRFTGRFLFQAVGTATMVAEMMLRPFSESTKNLYALATGNEDMRKQDSSFIQKFNDTIGIDAMSEYNDMFVKKWAEMGEDTYATEAEEKAMREHPMSWKSILSHKAMVDLADNMGFSAAAAATMAVAGPKAALGLGGAGLARTIGKQISDNENGDSTLQSFLPAIGAAAAIEVGKRVPGPWGKGLSMLLAGMAGATSEAEVEAIHAKQEYLDQKGQAVKADIDRRKQKISDYYTEQIKNATSEEEVMEIKQKQQDQMRVLDWEYTMTLSQAEKDIKEGQASIRWLNFAILSLSNAIQFGKLVNGGAKTFMTQVKLGLKDEAREFVDKAYEKEMRKAGWDVAKRFQVSRNKDAIKANAIDQWQRTSGKTAFEEAQKLSALDKMKLGAKMSLAEGAEEINQAAAANYGKRKAEVNTDRYYERLAGLDATNVDDYFSQVRGLEPYNKAEDGVFDALLLLSGWKKNDATKPNSTYEGWKSFGGTYGQESAWQEFTAGALMGALGVPFLRSARFTRTTGEKNADGTLKTESHWRSPIYMQGGIYNEIRQEMKKNELANKMIKRFNKLMTPEERTKMLKQFEYIAHHMQYEQDKDDASKGVFTSKDGSFRYSWNNAEDADIVKMVELFQNTGQMDLLRAMTNNMLGYQSADELRQLQKDTSNTEDNGTTAGPYSEFDLTELGENSSEADKQRLAGNVAEMKKKVKKNMDKILHAIDTYDAARRDLIYDSKQGLTDDQLNCLTWYKVRLAQFDKRTKEMFEKHLSDLSLFNDAIHGFVKEQKKDVETRKSQLSTELANLTDEKKKKETQAKIDGLNNNARFLDMAEAEWNDRWSRASKVDDNLKKARILFAGNELADPIGDTPARKPWYMPNKQWAKRVNESMSSAAERRWALTGHSFANIGLEGQRNFGFLGLASIYLSGISSELKSQSLNDKFSDPAEAAEFAEALNDMIQCQTAVVRFKDLYQFYKDNPYAMTQRQAQEEKKKEEEAKEKESNATVEKLKTCKDVASMYDTIVELIKNGTSVEAINDALNNLVAENSAIAKQLLQNQEYVKAFAAALTAIKSDTLSEDMHSAVLVQLMINASRECSSVAEMHKYVENKIKEITKDSQTFFNFLKTNNLLNDEDVTKDSFDEKIPDIVYKQDGNADFKATRANTSKQSRLDRIKKDLPVILNIADGIIKEKQFLKSQYSFGQNYDDIQRLKATTAMSQSLYEDVNQAASKLQSQIISIGSDVNINNQKTPPSSPQQGGGQQQGAGQQSGGQQSGGQQSGPSEPLADGEIVDNPEDHAQPAGQDEARNSYTKESSFDPRGGIWRPAVSFFSLAQKKLGKTIRQCFVKIVNNVTSIVANRADSPFNKFFTALENARCFSFVDETARDDNGAIQVGEDVYLIIDKINQQTGKSQIFNLASDEIEFNGRPIIFMAVKRGNSYQTIGSLTNNEEILKKRNQEAFYNLMKDKAEKVASAYVYDKTAKVKNLHAGLVEIQDKENNLNSVFGGRANVRLIARSKSETFATMSDDESANVNISAGHLYALVTDNATGKDIPMPVRVGHYNSEDEGRLKNTAKWKAVDKAIEELCTAAVNAQDKASANAATQEAYNKLSELLALQGYGIHINVEENPDSTLRLVISRVIFENGKPKLLTVKGKTMYRIDSEGNYEHDSQGNLIPLYDRTHKSVQFSAKDIVKEVKNILMSQEFNPPFRVTLDAIRENGQEVSDLIDQGILTVNIADNGGKHTHGGFAEVDATAILAEIDKDTQADKKKPQSTPPPAKNGTVTEYHIENFKFEVDDSATNSISVISVQNDGSTLKTKVSDEIARLLIPAVRSTERYYYITSDKKTLKIFVEDDAGVKEINVEGANISMKDVDSRFKHPFDIRSFYSNEQDLTRALTDNGFQDASDDGLLSYIEQLNNMSDDDRWGALSKLNDILSDKKYFDPFASPGWGVIVKNRPQAGPVLRDAYETLKATREQVASQDKPSDPQPPASQQQDNDKNKNNGRRTAPKGKGGKSDRHGSDRVNFSIFTKEDAFKEKADYSLEIAAVRRIAPFLARQEAVIIVDHLIETGQKGVLAQGLFRNGLMILSTSGVQGTAFHEAFHGIFQTALSKERQRALLGDAKRISGCELDSEAEEWLADAFRDYMVDQVYPKSWTRRIVDFFRSLFHLSRLPHHKLSPICRKIFTDINRGEYRNAGEEFLPTTLKEERIQEYKRLGLSSAEIRFLEGSKNNYAARSVEERSMLNDAGISEEVFNSLSTERRDELIRCL